MAKKSFESVSQYIAAQPEGARTKLRRVRAAIRKALPNAEETISYQIPTYKLGGRAALYFAGWKAHYSLYPATPLVLATFTDELAGHEVKKATIRFLLSEAVPVKLIEQIAQLRAKELAKRAKSSR
jgi:uncharacterized protein YdhG (YjbR/CyaY superfamily)